jgi:cytochrome P450
MNSPQKVQGGWVTAPETDFDPYANSSLDDPYPHFAKLRDLGPVFFLSRYSAYGVARHAEVEAVLRDPETFSSGAGVGLSNLQTQTYEEGWKGLIARCPDNGPVLRRYLATKS